MTINYAPGVAPSAGDYMKTAEAAAYIRVAESTMRYWRLTRTGPPYAHIGRRVVYRRADVDSWVESQIAEADAR